MTNLEYYKFKNIIFKEYDYDADYPTEVFGEVSRGVKIIEIYYHPNHNYRDILLRRMVVDNDDVVSAKAEWLLTEYRPYKNTSSIYYAGGCYPYRMKHCKLYR